MEKKKYQKPELKTRKIILGVFGNYGGRPSPGALDEPTLPIAGGSVIDAKYHME